MEEIQPDRFIVRYGNTRMLAPFSWKQRQPVVRGDEVIVKSRRGTEWGEVLSVATEQTIQMLKSDEQEGKILRQATREDRIQRDACREIEQKEFDGCCQMIAEHKLQMQLVDVEHFFGGERSIFYFVSESRIDFRDLVKDLNKAFNHRVEMRQIGVRDEAALLADYGDCGKPVCCNTHLSEMPPVSMKMAKVQKATLDPNKISGRCGRLKCCLRYEFDTYEDFRRELPRIGALVLTREGEGKVIAHEILAKKVVVAYEGRGRVLTPLQEIISVLKKKPPVEKNDTQPSESDTSSS